MAKRILEDFTPFSESILWKLQILAYQNFGLEAWREKGVPFYLTSSPLTASYFAKIALGFIQDIPKKIEEQITIIDLGAGTGRFAFLFLKFFYPQFKRLFPELKFKYVLTDISLDNLKFIETHPLFKPYFDSGIADSALFFHNQKEPIQLLKSKETLETLDTCILVANYFFDTIPQDLFRIAGQEKQKGLLRLSLPSDVEGPFNPDWIKELEIDCEYKKSAQNSPEIEMLLDFYKDSLENIPFLLPVGAFETLNEFKKRTKNPLLVLCSDQGAATLKQLKEEKLIRLDKHGTFSIPVNYHALKLQFERWDGFGLIPKLSDSKFLMMAGLLRGQEKDFPEMINAYKETLEFFEPREYWRMTGEIEEKIKEPSLALMLHLIRLGKHDPAVFYSLFPKLREALKKEFAALRLDLFSVIQGVDENFYPISKNESDIWQNLGVIAFESSFFEEARLLFNKAMAFSGETKALMMNLAASEFKAGDLRQAALHFEQAKTLP